MIARRLVLALALAITLALAPTRPAAAGLLDDIPLPGLRLVGNAIWHVNPARTGIGGFDLLPHLTFFNLEDGWRTAVLVGYGHEIGGTHLAQLGAEIGLVPSLKVGVDLGLRGLIGSTDGEFGGGLRVVAGVEVLLVIRLEVAYQMLHSARGFEHDVRVGVGIDLFRVVAAAVL